MEAEFAKAFVAMQTELPTVPKDRSGQEGNQKYRYADLASILEAAAPAMEKNGFALMQKPKCFADDGVTWAGVETILIHESGQSECVTTVLPVLREHGTMTKAIGGVITYSRRYALAILGICTDEDSESSPGVGGKPTASPSVRDAGEKPPRAKSDHGMSKPHREKLKDAAADRLTELDDTKATFAELLDVVAIKLGYSTYVEFKDSEFDAVLAELKTANSIPF